MNEVNTYCHVRFLAKREKIARHLNIVCPKSEQKIVRGYSS
jgi:hypothetical protein